MREAGSRPDLLQRFDGTTVAIGTAKRGLVHVQAFRDDFTDGPARRQRAVGILEHQLQRTPQRAHLAAVEAGDVGRAEAVIAAARQKPQQSAPERRLAGAGFTDNADRLALAKPQVDLVDRAEDGIAAGEKPTADRVVDTDVPTFKDDRCAVRRRCLAAARLCREQHLRIVGLRPLEDVCGRSLLHHFAAAHYRDAFGKVLDDAEIVRDQHDRHAEALLQRLQEIEDLSLDRHVKRCRRLVGDQKVRLVGERHRNHHALTLAARKLVRIAVDASTRLGDADQFEQFQHALARLLERAAAVVHDRFGDLPADRVERVERGHRLLEDHRDLGTAHAGSSALGERPTSS